MKRQTVPLLDTWLLLAIHDLILVAIALIAVAIRSVRSVAGVANVGGPEAQIVSVTTGRIAGVTGIVVGSPNAQVLSVAISSVAGVTSVTGVVRITRSGGRTGGRSVERNAGATIVGSPSVQVLNVAVKRSTGLAGSTNIVGEPGVQITNEVRAKPPTLSQSCIAYQFHTHQLEFGTSSYKKFSSPMVWDTLPQ